MACHRLRGLLYFFVFDFPLGMFLDILVDFTKHNSAAHTEKVFMVKQYKYIAI